MTTQLRTLDDTALLSHFKFLVQDQKKQEIGILLCIREIAVRRLELKAGFASVAEYCQEVFGMSLEVAWKRVRAAKAISMHPKLLELLKEGKTHISHVATVASHITFANSDQIFQFLPGANKRDLQFFLERLRPDGGFSEGEPMVEVKFRVKRSVLEKLDHLRGLMLKTGSGSSKYGTVLESALDALIAKKDPMKKAERAARKLTGSGSSRSRPAIPAATKHAVFLRDSGQCTFESSEGRRCGEKFLLHLDHVKPWALGGEHSVENLRLLCAKHNNYEAENLMGIEFMARKVQQNK